MLEQAAVPQEHPDLHRLRLRHTAGLARFRADVATYRGLGVRQIKSFVNGLDAEYVRRNGEPAFLAEFGADLEELLDR